MHDYEIDSLAYFVRLSYLYWKRTKRTCWMTNELERIFEKIVNHWIMEQDHNTKSKYTYPTLKPNGRGSRTCRTGMTWGGMRPSDDSMQYHYNIPANMFASVALTYMLEMGNSLGWRSEWLQRAETLRDEIDAAVREHGIVKGSHYAYEVDGCGNSISIDDANIPSLLSAKYLGFRVDENIMKETRSWILSKKNKWYKSGKVVSGIGSYHTHGKVWHLSLVMEALTDPSQTERILQMVLATSPDKIGDEFLIYTQSNCVRHRQQAFDAIAQIQTPTAGGRCHGSITEYKKIAISHSDWGT